MGGGRDKSSVNNLLRISAEALKPLVFDCTCRPRWLAAAVDTVDLVGLRDIQLVPVWDLLEVGAFVERAPEPGLPHGGVSFVPPLPVLAFIHSPGLSGGRQWLLLTPVYQYKQL